MKSIFLLLLCGISLGAFSQRLSAYGSLGFGSSIEKNIAGCDEQNRTRYIGGFGMYYRINGRISIGAEALGSGPLKIFNHGSCNVTDPSNNSLILSPSNLKAGTMIFRGRMLLLSYKEMEPFIGMGVGLNTYYYSDPVKDAGNIKKAAIVISPEFGIDIYKFQFSCKVIVGGKTPGYSGTDPEQQNRPVSLESIKAQQVYLTIGYQLFRL
jgi:hypothetical protein